MSRLLSLHFRPSLPGLAQVRFDPVLIAPLFISSRTTMEASFWTTMETHPQQAPLGIINLLISRRALMDSISRSLEVLLEMPYTTQFPPGLPPDLEQILRDLHASTERLNGRSRSDEQTLASSSSIPASCTANSTLAARRLRITTSTSSVWTGITFLGTSSPP